MPTLAEVEKYLPLSMDELVRTTNVILHDIRRLHVNPRLVRYYVAEKVIPSPLGGPKFARYEMEHLARLVGTRLMLNDGRSLADAKAHFDGYKGDIKKMVATVEEMLANRPMRRRTPAEEEPDLYEVIHRRPMTVREGRSTKMLGHMVERISLGSGVTLEIEAGTDLRKALEKARRAIDSQLDLL